MVLCLNGEVVWSNLGQYILFSPGLRSSSHLLLPQAFAYARPFLSPGRPRLKIPDLLRILSLLAGIHELSAHL